MALLTRRWAPPRRRRRSEQPYAGRLGSSENEYVLSEEVVCDVDYEHGVSYSGSSGRVIAWLFIGLANKAMILRNWFTLFFCVVPRE